MKFTSSFVSAAADFLCNTLDDLARLGLLAPLVKSSFVRFEDEEEGGSGFDIIIVDNAGVENPNNSFGAVGL